MPEPGPGGDHQIALGKEFAGEIARKGAGDVERERVAVEQALGQQGRRQQCTAVLGECLQRFLGARPDRTAPADDHRPLGAGDHRDDLVDQCRVGHHHLRDAA